MKICNLCHTTQPDENVCCCSCGSYDLAVMEGAASGAGNKKQKKGAAGLVIGVAAAAVVVIAAIVAAVILLNPVRQVMSGIKGEDYDKAAQVYAEKIAGDQKKYQEAYDQVSEYAQELMEQYRNQEISYEYLTSQLSGIERVGILGWEIYDIYAEADYLNWCRETFDAAELAFDRGDYDEAISLYEQVAYADFENSQTASDKYAQAAELYRQETADAVNGYIAAGEFEMATTVLGTALTVLPGDAELMDLEQQCIQAEYDHDIQLLLEQARVYQDGKDYAGAIDFLDASISAYPEELLLQQEKSDCLADYEAYVISESLRLAGEGEYRHALSLTEAGLGYFSSTQVSELAMVYRSYIPVILGEMEMFQNNTDGGMWATKTDEANKYLQDNYGNVYEHSMSVGCGSVTYLVNFKYQSFSGVVAFPKGLESDGARSSATLLIYGDEEFLAEFTGMDEASKPQVFELDIHAYEKITLKWGCEGYNIWRDWGDFATIFDGTLIPIPLEIPEQGGV